MPGRWIFETIDERPLTTDELREIIREIIEAAKSHPEGFIERERPGSTIIQLADMRIVITRPPFSDGLEITAVRPIRKLSLEEYNLPDKERIKFKIKKKLESCVIYREIYNR